MEAFIRGCAWPGTREVPYPRAKPDDASRLPIDTWGTARTPVGVRIEWVGSAPSVAITYRTETSDLGYRGAGAGTTFQLWRSGELRDEQPAELGEGRVELAAGDGAARAIVYLPEGMRPTVLAVDALDGEIEPAPAQPKWLAYGDSVAEGWCASSPAGAWPALAGRRYNLDVRNLGYAGAARGEIVSAEQLAGVAASVISITHGTNCWTRVPFSEGMLYEGTRAFLEVVRQGHPETPIVVVSPVVRPDAEATPNRLGATLADLRRAMERATDERIGAGDDRLWLIPGGDLLRPEHLSDGIHPDDAGHEILAEVIGTKVAEVAKLVDAGSVP